MKGKKGKRGNKKQSDRRARANVNLVIGRNAVAEVFRLQPERIKKVLVAEEIDKASERGRKLYQELQRAGIKIEKTDTRGLDALTGSESHQSFAAYLTIRELPSFRELLEALEEREKSLVVVLDGVTDPHNLGAVMRACECFGVDALLWPERGAAKKGPVVSKASAGASELVLGLEVGNLVNTLNQLKEAGYWIVAADVSGETKNLTEFETPGKIVLVLGSEGKGIRPLVLSQCDFSIKIPQKGRIDSLNVSQAAAVFLYHFSTAAA